MKKTNIQQSFKTASEYYARGCKHFRADEFDDAEADFTNAIIRDQKFTEAWVFRGDVYAKTEKHDTAIENFMQALQLISANTQLRPGERSRQKVIVLSRIADAKLTQGKQDEAFQFSNEAVKLMEGGKMDKDFAAPWYIRGMVWLKRGSNDIALHYFTKAACADYTSDSLYENSLLERARLLQKSWKCKEAIDDCNRILQRNPDQVEALVERAGCWIWEKFETLGMPQRLEDLRRAVRISPEHPKALAGLANCLFSIKRFEEAGEVAAKALKLNLEDEKRTERLGSILEEAQRKKEAREKALADYHAFVREYPGMKISSHRKGAHIKEEEFDKVIEETGRILLVNRHDVNARSKRVAACIGKGSLEKAKEDLDELIELQPDNSIFPDMRERVEFF